jgi:hypothetical protein
MPDRTGNAMGQPTSLALNRTPAEAMMRGATPRGGGAVYHLEEGSMSTEHPDDIVRLARAVNPLEAHIWQQALEEEGIHCKVVGDYLDAAIGDIPGAQAEVWVHRDDVARAEEVLRRAREDQGKPEE